MPFWRPDKSIGGAGRLACGEVGAAGEALAVGEVLATEEAMLVESLCNGEMRVRPAESCDTRRALSKLNHFRNFPHSDRDRGFVGIVESETWHFAGRQFANFQVQIDLTTQVFSKKSAGIAYRCSKVHHGCSFQAKTAYSQIRLKSVFDTALESWQH